MQGAGFASGEVVTIALTDGSDSSSLLGRFTSTDCDAAGADGTQSAASCVSGSFSALASAPVPQPSAFSTAPATAGGAPSTVGYALTAVGQTSGLAAAGRLGLTNAPTLTLQHYVVTPGQGLIVEGNAFTPNAVVHLTAAFPSSTSGGSCAVAQSPGAAVTCTASLVVATDGGGSFKVPITVPLSAPIGPVAIQAQDEHGQLASAVLTVNTQYPSVRTTLFAQPGQVVVVHGGGFGSGETVDVSLVTLSGPIAGTGANPTVTNTRCGSLVAQPLSNSTITSTADALGSFTASYPLPQPFIAGTYYLASLGETSRVCAFTPITIARALPTALPTPSPCPKRSCAHAADADAHRDRRCRPLRPAVSHRTTRATRTR